MISKDAVLKKLKKSVGKSVMVKNVKSGKTYPIVVDRENPFKPYFLEVGQVAVRTSPDKTHPNGMEIFMEREKLVFI
jgi:hypothetical protein